MDTIILYQVVTRTRETGKGNDTCRINIGGIADLLPGGGRISAALTSYIFYIWKMILPLGLAAPYTHTAGQPLSYPAGAALLITGITVLTVRSAANQPWLLTGWLWYVITLFPVSGLTGPEIRADRYTYIPLTGVFIMTVWGIDSLI